MSKAEEKETVLSPVEKEKPGVIDGGGQLQFRGEEAAPGGNIEKVRDILFGAQIRDFDKRFLRMEERLAKEVANLRDEARKRSDSIESYAKKEIELLSDRLVAEQNDRTDSVKREVEAWGDRLKVEQSERIESLKELSREMKEANRLLEKKLGQLDDQLNKIAREIRQQLLDQSKELSEVIRLKYEDSMTALGKVAHELRLDKVDRAKLSELLMGMALHLTDEAGFEDKHREQSLTP